jgi:hypothetical protein
VQALFICLKLTFDHLGKPWEMDDQSEKAINAYYRDFSKLQKQRPNITAA